MIKFRNLLFSVAWDAKVVTNAYWVWGNQVTKTAPTGEYLSTGSFMIRGKKNFLPPSHLILGLGFLFRLEDGSVERHLGERKVLTQNEEDALSIEASEQSKDEVEVEIPDESDEEETKEDTATVQAADKENTSEQPESDENVQKNVSEGSKIQSVDSSDEEEDLKFPDTQIKIQHFAGTKINILTEPSNIENKLKDEDEDNVIYLGDDKPIILTSKGSKSRGNSESKNKKPKDQDKKVEFKDSKQQQLQQKRGQKSKLKKIKEKYKDQDDEERKLRMDILQSSGSSKDTKKNKKNKDGSSDVKRRPEPRQPRPVVPKEPGEEGDEEEPTVQADVDMIDSLTGIPVSEDELLFAVPVVAPYNTLSNYKFKVKLTPGTGKRGKAAKTAVAMFLKDRSVTPREKDLLKAVKDEQLARNIPGKVKLSAPRLQNLRK
nr:unnamed protein product [Callosobruchus chinensis]